MPFVPSWLIFRRGIEMEFSQILYAKENRVATVTLNRPEKLNAYSETMVHEILAALAGARDDDEIRAVIITGAGRGFCSGGDISRDFCGASINRQSRQ